MLRDAFLKYYVRFKGISKSKLSKKSCFENFIKLKHRQFFKVIKKAVLYDHHEKTAVNDEFRILDSKAIDINKIISFKYISARRDTVNRDNDSTLSNLSGNYYERTKADSEEPSIQQFEDALVMTDASLTTIYQGIFDNVIKKIKKFGGMQEDETIINIISTLSQQQLLRGNTTVVYETENHQLPESYNGLGYLNLISMIIEIEILLSEFRKDKDESMSPADINMLFIEEPEAHTHPQMQYIFIKNIKGLLNEGKSGENGKKAFALQTIITTHSSHIVAECDFDDIKYFKKISRTRVISKNLKDLETAYKKEKNKGSNHFKFLKQYLTLNYAEIFFADKVILCEGETERILLPSMMKKIDEEEMKAGISPLLSQNITIVESGSYSHIFDRFLSFIDIKTLIITDIDSCIAIEKTDKNGKRNTDLVASIVEDGTHTSNGTLKHFYAIPLKAYSGTQLQFFKELHVGERILGNTKNKWSIDGNGNLMLIYQTCQTVAKESYYPRSFEDAFFHINRRYVIDAINMFVSLKNKENFEEIDSTDGSYKFSPYELAERCIKSKSSFALDVLLNSKAKGDYTFGNWEIPSYIKEGLLWLR